MHLAVNKVDLLDDFTGLVGFCPVPELYESSNNVFDESSEDDEDRNPTKFQPISVQYGHVLVILRVPLRLVQIIDLQEPVAPYSYNRPFQLFFLLRLLLVLS